MTAQDLARTTLSSFGERFMALLHQGRSGISENSRVDKEAQVDHRAVVRGSTLKGKVIIEKNARVESSELNGDITIEAHARVARAHLRGKVTIGYHSDVQGPNTEALSKINAIDIGRYSSVARDVVLQEHDHRTDRLSTYYIQRNVFGRPAQLDVVSKGAISIGHDVWIGARVVVLSGVRIGNGAVIGAGSVVNTDVPEFGVAVGSPARVTKFRFEPSIIERLNALGWWHWSREEIKERNWLFDAEISHELLDKL